VRARDARTGGTDWRFYLNGRSASTSGMARKKGSHAELTGPRIRAAALRLIARDGYAAVSMRQLAGEVGLQAGALYLYADSKEALLRQLVLGFHEELLAEWQQVVLPASPVERLEAFVRFHLRFHLARPEAVAVSVLEGRNLGPEAMAPVAELRERHLRVLETILAEGHAAGGFQVPDTRLAALAIVAMLTGSVSLWRDADGRLPRGRAERILWNMVRRSVGA
jgi:AcrR family transcriptional regulator